MITFHLIRVDLDDPKRMEKIYNLFNNEVLINNSNSNYLKLSWKGKDLKVKNGDILEIRKEANNIYYLKVYKLWQLYLKGIAKLIESKLKLGIQ